jgi:hypothetical protein
VKTIYMLSTAVIQGKKNPHKFESSAFLSLALNEVIQ